jgi:NADH-quinone oxidoreductase subunit F
MALVTRVLDPAPVESLSAYVDAGGGAALAAAREVEPVTVAETIAASGLRGRGGAGFPTGTKWKTMAEMASRLELAQVVVNAAEGEPGTFKDRTLLRRNPYRVLEGALIAAHAVCADRVVVGMKERFTHERALVAAAIAEVVEAGWADGISVEIATGPNEYLLGEETALLEAIAGRPPFPRVAPPFRHGAEEVGDDVPSPATSELASETDATSAAPTLVNNVETLANVPGIVANGPEWFRSLGTPESPGTVVCTVSGRVERAGVAELELGTPLHEVIEVIGGAPIGDRVVAVVSGTANPILRGDRLDAPVSYEGLRDAGGGLGSAGFIVIDEHVDIVSVAQGLSRFLAIESCGQCSPCKQDGRAIADALDRFRSSAPRTDELERLAALAQTVTTGARCFLASQQEAIVTSLLARFPDALAAHADGSATAAEPFLVAPLVDIDEEGVAVLDDSYATKNPDWTHGGVDSGQAPAERVDVRLGDRA